MRAAVTRFLAICAVFALAGCAGAPDPRAEPEHFIEGCGLLVHCDVKRSVWSLHCPGDGAEARILSGVGSELLLPSGAVRLHVTSCSRLDDSSLFVSYGITKEEETVQVLFSLLDKPTRLEVTPTVGSAAIAHGPIGLRLATSGKSSGLILPGAGEGAELLVTSNGPPWRFSVDESSGTHPRRTYGALLVWPAGRAGCTQTENGADPDTSSHLNTLVPDVKGFAAFFQATALRENWFEIVDLEGAAGARLGFTAECRPAPASLRVVGVTGSSCALPKLVILAEADPWSALAIQSFFLKQQQPPPEETAPALSACDSRCARARAQLREISWCWNTTQSSIATESDVLGNAKFIATLAAAPDSDRLAAAIEVGHDWRNKSFTSKDGISSNAVAAENGRESARATRNGGETAPFGDLTVAADRFPGGLRKLAEGLKRLGVEARIWLDPYAVSSEPGDDLAKLLLRDIAGGPIVIEDTACAAGAPASSYVLDPRRLETQWRISSIARILVRDWKFDTIRFDLRTLVTALEKLGSSSADDGLGLFPAAVENLREILKDVAPEKPLLSANSFAMAWGRERAPAFIEVGASPQTHARDPMSLTDGLVSLAYLAALSYEVECALSLNDPMTDDEANIALAVADMTAGPILLTGDVAGLTPAKQAALARTVTSRPLAGAKPLLTFPRERPAAPRMITTSGEIAPREIALADWTFRVGDDLNWATDFADSMFWKPAKVPLNWEDRVCWQRDAGGWKHVGGEPRPYDGFAWYRTSIEIPEEWNGQEIVFELGRISDVDALYVNGRKVHQTGAFPPTFRSASGAFRSYELKAGRILRVGERNFLHVRVYDAGDEGGIYSLASNRLPELWIRPTSAGTSDRGPEQPLFVVVNSDRYFRDIRASVEHIRKCDPLFQLPERLTEFQRPDGKFRWTIEDGVINFGIAPMSVFTMPPLEEERTIDAKNKN